jgi:hypothetical protein
MTRWEVVIGTDLETDSTVTLQSLGAGEILQLYPNNRHRGGL